MSKIKIYSKKVCPYCVNVKKFFEQKGLLYQEVDVEKDPQDYFDLVNKYNYMTVPMVFINNQFVGGFSDIMELERRGKLEEKLKD